MIKRGKHIRALLKRLQVFPVVGILGPRQIGKTTLARQITETYAEPAHWLDLEHPPDLNRLMDDPNLVLDEMRGLIIIDEVQRCPELFPVLRVLADRQPLPARFLILGSASPNLLRQSSESLAGRISYYELAGLSVDEPDINDLDRRWLRGGFPKAWLADTDALGFHWISEFTRTFIERDLPELGLRETGTTMHRFWTMLAHWHGQTWNAAPFANSLDMTGKTVRNHLNLLTDALVVRQLQPWFKNMSKRQVKAPKIYFRDTGLLHGLLGLNDVEALRAHPSLGASWEGFVLEAIIDILGLENKQVSFWATHNGAELDLIVDRGNQRLGVEIKHTSKPKVTASMRIALDDLKLDEIMVVHAGMESYRLAEQVRAVSIRELADIEQGQTAATQHKPDPEVITITVRLSGTPVAGADLLTLFPNKTHKRATTDDAGEARVRLHRRDLPMTVFCAVAGATAGVARDWVPAEGNLTVELEPLPNGGAVIFEKATGYVPELSGRLNPIRDSQDRTYLYTDNIAINGGQHQPVYFSIGERLRLTDADGNERLARIIEIIGRAALVEYAQEQNT